jgi:hypothetical protein
VTVNRETMYCPACGEEVDDSARFCRVCGEEVTPSEQDTGIEYTEPIEATTRVEHQCQSCGEMLRGGEPPCRHCGGMDIETRPVEPEIVDEDAATADSGEKQFDDPSRSFIWPAGPFYPIQRLCGWGIVLSIAASILLSILLGDGGVAAAIIIGYFVLPWLVIGFVGSWFIDTILVYLKS